VNSDVWSLGVTLLECAIGHYPYLSPEYFIIPTQNYRKSSSSAGEITYWEVFDKIVKAPSPKLESPDFSDSFKDFIARCLEKNKENRISSQKLLVFSKGRIKKLKEHPFLAKYAAIDVKKNLKEWLKLVIEYEKKIVK